MDATTLEALKGSIKHWKRLLAGEKGERPDGQQCPLCQLHFTLIVNECGECPVAVKTGKTCCHGSPFYDARNAFDRLYQHETVETRRVWKEEATKMLEFLRGLLPGKTCKTCKKGK